MIAAYWQRLDSEDPATRIAAAQAWLGWEDNAASLVHDVDAVSTADPLDTLAKARIEAHYFRHNAFLAHGQLLRDIDRIRHLPGVIVQGRVPGRRRGWKWCCPDMAQPNRPPPTRWCVRRTILPSAWVHDRPSIDARPTTGYMPSKAMEG